MGRATGLRLHENRYGRSTNRMGKDVVFVRKKKRKQKGRGGRTGC